MKEKFWKFTNVANSNRPKPIYVRLDSIIGVFENRFTAHASETVLGMTGGQNYRIAEPMDEVIKILEKHS